MMLSDKDLKKLALEQELVNPFIEDHCEGASINLTLASVVKRPIHTQPLVMGEKMTDDMYETYDLTKTDFYVDPGETVHVNCVEFFKVPTDKAALIIERYSIKLLGLVVSPASYMNPGYQGEMTFLLTNQSKAPIQLVAGMKFCQLILHQLTTEAEKPYQLQDGKYMGSTGVAISKLHMEQDIQDFLKNKGIENVSSDTAKELGDFLMKRIDKSAEKIAQILREKFGDPDEQST